MIRFADLLERCQRASHPEGLAENLVEPYRRFVAEGLVTAQKYVDQLRDRHVNAYPQCATYWFCHMTVVAAPPGLITEVWTESVSDPCDRVIYDQIDFDQLKCVSCAFGSPQAPGVTAPAAADSGARAATPETDRPYRARVGFFAVHEGKIWVLPAIRSDERLMVKWAGYKTEWTDEDEIEDDPLLERAVRLYAEREFALHFERDGQLTEFLGREWAKAFADLLHEMAERERVVPRIVCEGAARATRPCPTPPAADGLPEGLRIVYISDYTDRNSGIDSEAFRRTKELVLLYSPHHIWTGGDNAQDNRAQTIRDVASEYAAYIGRAPQENRFWPALGNHDLDNSEVEQAYYTSFFLPGVKRYYDVLIWPVHLFVLNSESSEPHGRTETSAQAEWLRVKLAVSKAPWKVVVAHKPPYTSTLGYCPGNLDMRWPYQAWGADFMLCGHRHVYERIDVDGFTYIVAGWSGAELHTVDPSFCGHPELAACLKAYEDEQHGIVVLGFTATKATIEAVRHDGTVVDRIELTK